MGLTALKSQFGLVPYFRLVFIYDHNYDNQLKMSYIYLWYIQNTPPCTDQYCLSRADNLWE